jgi:ATP-dependent exoDNAse (exonuclease V) beta subunit
LNFLVYKSSAGSGKTFTLVREFLRLALHDEKKLSSTYKKILAITFTTKAAAEMKQRVIEALNAAAKNEKPSPLQEELCKELQIDARELARRASFVLGQILHHYSDLSIGTIDSFTHKIVKTFAHDLQLPLNFNIELDTEGFYEKVIALLMSKIGEDEYVSKLLRDYALNKVQDNAAWDPEGHIRDFARILQKENSDHYISRLREFDSDQLEEFRKQFIDYTRHYRHFLRTEGKKALDLIRNNGLTDNDFVYKSSGPQKFFEKAAQVKLTPDDAKAPRITDAIVNGKWSGKTSPGAEERMNAIAPQLSAIASEIVSFVQSDYSYYSLCELLSKQMYPLMLLKKIEEISREQKQEERLVFISEFNQKIFDIINNEPAPFIYERLGDRYQHYLLDEFQDTSSLQWQNILPLLDNSLAGGWFNLIVGDGKQSIYRWRNANVQQFADLPQLRPTVKANEGQAGLSDLQWERAQSLQRNFEGRNLDTNYRSAKNIVSFNNDLFRTLSSRLLNEKHQVIYEGQQQKIKSDIEGYVGVHTGVVARDEYDRVHCELTEQFIRDAREQNYNYRDICVLCRTNVHGNIIASHLMAKGIPIVSADSLLLANNFEICTLLSFLRYLSNRQDVINASAVINYLWQSKQIAGSEVHPLLRKLAQGESLVRILNELGISMNESELALNNLFDNCVSVIKALKLNERGYHYLRFFLDEVNEFLVLHNSDVQAFFDWWEVRARKSSMIIPDDADAVKVMTIHASKGLEFPVVIVPYFNCKIYKANDAWVEFKNEKILLPVSVVSLSKKAADSGFGRELKDEEDEQILDNLNLMYVAFTRAVERLHITALKSSSNKLPGVSDWLNEFFGMSAKAGENQIYEFGQRTARRSVEKKKPLPSFDLQPLVFNSPEDSIRIKGSYKLDSQEAENARRQGILIHWLLSQIKDAGDIEEALDKSILSGAIRKEEKEDLKQNLTSLCEHESLKGFFEKNANVKIEAELITAQGEILRPDRILFTEEVTYLLDYKTGNENNTVYFKQLQRYEKALEDMGHKTIKKLLVYVDDIRVILVN